MVTKAKLMYREREREIKRRKTKAAKWRAEWGFRRAEGDMEASGEMSGGCLASLGLNFGSDTLVVISSFTAYP